MKKEIVITDVHIEYLTINFSVLFHSCFVSAQSRMKTIKEILPKNVYSQGHSNEWYYNSEESFVKTLEMLAQYAVDYGIDGLEQMSIPSAEPFPTLETDMILFEEHKNLSDEYSKIAGIIINDKYKDIDNIKIVIEKIKELRNQEFHEIEHHLIGFAAVFGEICVNNWKMKWKKDSENRCLIENEEAYDISIWPLEEIIRIWKDSDGSVLIDNCTYYKNREKYRHY